MAFGVTIIGKFNAIIPEQVYNDITTQGRLSSQGIEGLTKEEFESCAGVDSLQDAVPVAHGLGRDIAMDPATVPQPTHTPEDIISAHQEISGYVTGDGVDWNKV